MESSVETKIYDFKVFGTLLFFLELYHLFGHLSVLLRIRLLPRKDLRRVRFYFLIDLLTVAAVNYLYTQTRIWLAVLQNIQHLFFFLTWDKHPYCKKVITWSSLDWQRSWHSKHWKIDITLGTAFDAVVHGSNLYLLSNYLSGKEMIMALFINILSVYAVLLNSKLAWSSPCNTPAWIEKRVKPINEQGTDSK